MERYQGNHKGFSYSFSLAGDDTDGYGSTICIASHVGYQTTEYLLSPPNLQNSEKGAIQEAHRFIKERIDTYWIA